MSFEVLNIEPQLSMHFQFNDKNEWATCHLSIKKKKRERERSTQGLGLACLVG